MIDFQQQALQLAADQDSPAWLRDLRSAGAREWREARWPDRKTELWKYTPLRALQEQAFDAWGQAGGSWQDEVELLDLDATRLVFVNGELDASLSDELPDEVSLFSRAQGDTLDLLQRHIGTVLDTKRHLFAALANAWAHEGVLLHVAPGKQLARPLYVVHVATRQAEASVASARILVLLDEGARAELVEHYASTALEQNGFVNALTEIRLGNNAELRHTRINLEHESLLHIGGVHVDLRNDARLYGFTIAEGSRLKRIDYQVNHRAAGAHAGLTGVYLAQGRQLLDYHTNIEHAAPHCTTEEVFRGIIGDHAKAVFNGRIHIHPDAQKTLAELSNRNLLTSDTAEIDTKPELEIYADDVKCAHGATVSQLDATALYYLQSRGIPESQARVMLSFAFINELLLKASGEVIQNYLARHLQALFERSDSLIGLAGRAPELEEHA